ncbi:Ribonuclease T2 family protein [Rubellimicrobium mesophilum DSM 19309]|uniref:Ribonuclease T2 family protein n=1 Tax=Rubellimicrobium mesophilum DSM 19309 TaxID=442562 RepID=A0A017HJP5_9RHOB|nr:ribonuclease T2 [Rubellimicrobium mesophilum]EYD74546.1 Ribonuclease T2 family protein [Rubellimicrobium mesophilum DSM 19309]
MHAALALALTLATPALAQEAGDFDYYVLSLSWSPTWCATEGDPGDAQCEPGAGYGWILHGLWPQYEVGWPEDCRGEFRDPSRRETAAMADIMGSGGLAWHEWNVHGTCSGLSPEDYFDLAREAYGSVAIPPGFARIRETEEVPARAVEEAFLRSNPGLTRDGVTVTCQGDRLQEVRICLDRDGLTPRACGEDAGRDCTRPDAVIEPIP